MILLLPRALGPLSGSFALRRPKRTSGTEEGGFRPWRFQLNWLVVDVSHSILQSSPDCSTRMLSIFGVAQAGSRGRHGVRTFEDHESDAAPVCGAWLLSLLADTRRSTRRRPQFLDAPSKRRWAREGRLADCGDGVGTTMYMHMIAGPRPD